MKRTLTVGVLSIAAGVSSWGAQQSLSGKISDSMCGSDHAGMGEIGKNPKECTAACVKGGAKFVFVSNGKIYSIENQKFGGLAKDAGATVQVTGDLAKDGKAITITKLEPLGHK
jgi:hypothetical protein